jgi:transcriptional regulator with PAS, ATPase and Fis domain
MRQAEFIERVSDDVMAALVRYDWPGNIRELQKVRANAVGATAAPLADYVKEYDDVYFELDRIQS